MLDAAAIRAVLGVFPLHPPRTLMVHSSLSACGRIAGGAEAVIGVLSEWNRGGTLVMPTHSYNYPRSGGVVPVFDANETPSVVGAITEAFRRRPGVVRSLHPTHSLAAIGPGAASLVAAHEACDTPCGRGTPYERLVEQDAAVLMFGTTLETYTLFHTAEDAADVPTLYEPWPVRLRYRAADGDDRELVMRRQDMQVPRRFRELDGRLEKQGLLQRATLGRGEILFVPHARDIHAYIVEELRRDPGFLNASGTAKAE